MLWVEIHSILPCRVLLVYPYDHVADWELLFPATAQYHQRVSYCISLSQGKAHSSKFEAQFILNAYHFCTVKLKNYKSDQRVVYAGVICTWYKHNIHLIKFSISISVLVVYLCSNFLFSPTLLIGHQEPFCCPGQFNFSFTIWIPLQQHRCPFN